MESFYKVYGKENTDVFFEALFVMYPEITTPYLRKFVEYHTEIVIRDLKDNFGLSQGGLWERWKDLPEDEQKVFVRFVPNKRKKT